MALFGLGKKSADETKVVPAAKEKKEKKAPAAKAKVDAPVVKAVVSSGATDLTHILVSPRITEKATMHSAQGVYVFEVADSATKRSVMQAVLAHYKVMPRMVRVVSIPTKVKRNPRTGKMGVKHGGKKAYVYLKKGEQITIS